MGGRGGEVSPLGILMGRGLASGKTMGLLKMMPACHSGLHEICIQHHDSKHASRDSMQAGALQGSEL